MSTTDPPTGAAFHVHDLEDVLVHRALASWLGRAPWWTGAELLQPRTLDGPLGGYDRPAPLFDRICGLAIDDANVRALASLPSHARARRFEALRRDYALRREFDAWRIPPGMVGSPSLARTLAALGFGP